MGRSSAGSTRLWGIGTGVTLAVAALFIFRLFLAGGPERAQWDDQPAHVKYVVELPERPVPVPHPLYHWTVGLALALSRHSDWWAAAFSAAVVQALAVGLRGWLTHRELSPPMPAPGAAVACWLLAFAMSLPPHWSYWKLGMIYLGQIHPNVWHNPTAVFVCPLALVVFLAAMHYLDAPGPGAALGIGVGSALCALAKPNYLLAFLPCFAPALLFVVAREWWVGRRPIWRALVEFVTAFGPPVGVLAWQYWWAFGGDNRVIIRPFAAWRQYSEDIPISILAGVAFPAAVVLCYRREAGADRRVLFAWAILAVAVGHYALLAETELLRFISVNFSWGAMAADYVLFVESCRLVGRQPFGIRAALCYSLLVAHAASGSYCLYLFAFHPAGTRAF